MPLTLALQNKVTLVRVDAKVCQKYIELCKLYIVDRCSLTDDVPIDKETIRSVEAGDWLPLRQPTPDVSIVEMNF